MNNALKETLQMTARHSQRPVVHLASRVWPLFRTGLVIVLLTLGTVSCCLFKYSTADESLARLQPSLGTVLAAKTDDCGDPISFRVVGNLRSMIPDSDITIDPSSVRIDAGSSRLDVSAEEPTGSIKAGLSYDSSDVTYVGSMSANARQALYPGSAGKHLYGRVANVSFDPTKLARAYFRSTLQSPAQAYSLDPGERLYLCNWMRCTNALQASSSASSGIDGSLKLRSIDASVGGSTGSEKLYGKLAPDAIEVDEAAWEAMGHAAQLEKLQGWPGCDWAATPWRFSQYRLTVSGCTVKSCHAGISETRHELWFAIVLNQRDAEGKSDVQRVAYPVLSSPEREGQFLQALHCGDGQCPWSVSSMMSDYSVDIGRDPGQGSAVLLRGEPSVQFSSPGLAQPASVVIVVALSNRTNGACRSGIAELPIQLGDDILDSVRTAGSISKSYLVQVKNSHGPDGEKVNATFDVAVTISHVGDA